MVAQQTHPADPPIRYTTVNVAAELLNVSTKTIRGYIAAGILPAVKLGIPPRGRIRDNRPVRIPIDALDAITEPVTIPASQR